ncbi:hypothetical protein [[Mycoplasma] gypis]|uniref:Uncharacterized protein n=1 Tax=[Mycoplasma] gypis TaxID=92404 RepID=A0ABZ2RRU1_9BACT|nr:hypothetical protein [[Mycoplasma] gypis]MBN0919506.1 hypothetical protein [[Mycoplasma] gypis]
MKFNNTYKEDDFKNSPDGEELPKTKKIRKKWNPKHSKWIFLGLATAFVAGITIASVVSYKKDKFWQSYDYKFKVYNRKEINNFITITPKPEVSTITAKEFVQTFKNKRDIHSDFVSKFFSIDAKFETNSNLKARFYNLVLDVSNNIVLLTIQINNNSNKEIKIFDVEFKGFKETKKEFIDNNDLNFVKDITFTPKNKDQNNEIIIGELNKISDPEQRTIKFLDYFLVKGVKYGYSIFVGNDSLQKPNGEVIVNFLPWTLFPGEKEEYYIRKTAEKSFEINSNTNN